MASIIVEREQEAERPPARSVQITLTPDEANLLGDFFGHLSRNKVQDVLPPTTSQLVIEATYTLTAGLYVKLYDEELVFNES